MKAFFFRKALAVVALVLASACAPAAPPGPTAPPAKPTEAPKPAAAPAKPTEPTAAPAAKPAPTAAPAKAEAKPAGAKPAASPAVKTEAKPAAKIAPPADWQAQWDRTVAAAKQEKALVLHGPNVAILREALMEFQKAYPDIRIEFFATPINEFTSKITAERGAGQFLYDTVVTGTSVQRFLKPGQVLDPIRPTLLLPEILDDSKWNGGFDAGWSDSQQNYVYIFQGSVGNPCWVNRDNAPESELASYQQLLDPKWKGKVVWQDPRAAGAGSGNATHLMVTLGEDYIRKLFAQDVVLTSDGRQQMEWLVRGQYPIACGISTGVLVEFQGQGLAKNVKALAPNSSEGARLSTGFGALHLVNRPPHPNAAKVFANWLLSRAGQTAWAKVGKEASRRLDVTDNPPERTPDPKVKLLNLNDEEAVKQETKLNTIAKEVLK